MELKGEKQHGQNKKSENPRSKRKAQVQIMRPQNAKKTQKKDKHNNRELRQSS